MASLFHAALETNPHNDSGSVLALFFEGTPTPEEVTKTAHDQSGKHCLGLSVEEKAEYEVCPTKVSDRAGLVRVLVFNVG